MVGSTSQPIHGFHRLWKWKQLSKQGSWEIKLLWGSWWHSVVKCLWADVTFFLGKFLVFVNIYLGKYWQFLSDIGNVNWGAAWSTGRRCPSSKLNVWSVLPGTCAFTTWASSWNQNTQRLLQVSQKLRFIYSLNKAVGNKWALTLLRYSVKLFIIPVFAFQQGYLLLNTQLGVVLTILPDRKSPTTLLWWL